MLFRSGIDIQIITAGRADKNSAYLMGEQYIKLLNEGGIKIYRMKNLFIHSKFYIFDDEILLTGTTNLDYRALYLHYETNLILKDKNLVKKTIEIFEKYKKNAYIIINENINLTLKDKIKIKLLKFFAPIF